MRTIAALTLMILMISPMLTHAAADVPVVSQTDPAPTPEPTEVPNISRWEEVEGTTVRFDYVISAGDVAVAGLLLVLVVSVWVFGGLFFIGGYRD
jgi:hypothetical protein